MKIFQKLLKLGQKSVKESELEDAAILDAAFDQASENYFNPRRIFEVVVDDLMERGCTIAHKSNRNYLVQWKGTPVAYVREHPDRYCQMLLLVDLRRRLSRRGREWPLVVNLKNREDWRWINHLVYPAIQQTG